MPDVSDEESERVITDDVEMDDDKESAMETDDDTDVSN